MIWKLEYWLLNIKEILIFGYFVVVGVDRLVVVGVDIVVVVGVDIVDDVDDIEMEVLDVDKL